MNAGLDPTADTPTEVAAPVVELRGVVKSYGGVRALRGVDFVIDRPGTVHALTGENGSGKSTLLGILSGQLRPDEGTMAIFGEPVAFSGPVAALRHGVAMVAQETALALPLSVAENILLGRRLVRGRRGIDWIATRRRAAEVLELLELDVQPGVPVETLRPDERQMVEIGRALSMDARILILDEPTSSLTEDEVESLFRVLQRVRTRGVTTIFVSHRGKELFAIADEITVLRDGVRVSYGPAARYDAHSLVKDMVGTATERVETWGGTSTRVRTELKALEIDRISCAGVLTDIELDVEAGEIVGLAGLVGSGRSALLELIFGVRLADAGKMMVYGKPYTPASARDGIHAGIGLLPADRRHQGLVLGMSVRENMLMVKSSGRHRLGRPRGENDTATIRGLMDALRTRAASPDVPVGALSGGNQQKVALGKWLAAESRLLLLDEPTRGVDVSAKAEIHALLRKLADEGQAQLVSSSENEELLALCHRVVVLFRGRVATVLTGAQLSEANIAYYAGGHHE